MINISEDRFYEEVGEKIRKARIGAGVSQEVIAEYLSLTRASIVNIEKGRQRPSIYLLIVIADLLKIDYIDLVPVELNVQRYPKAIEHQEKIDFNTVIASESLDLSEKVKDSINEFLNQIKTK